MKIFDMQAQNDTYSASSNTLKALEEIGACKGIADSWKQ